MFIYNQRHSGCFATVLAWAHSVGAARGGVRFADAEVVMVEGDASGEQHEMQPTAAGGDGELHAPYLALVDSDGETAGSGA